MSNKTTTKPAKKSMIRWGTKFDFWPVKDIEILGKSKKALERSWNRLCAIEPFNPAKCNKVKVTKV